MTTIKHEPYCNLGPVRKSDKHPDCNCKDPLKGIFGPEKQFFIIPAHGRRSNEVVGFDGFGRWIGTWICDSKAIAQLVQKRLRAGKHPGQAARDLRLAMK